MSGKRKRPETSDERQALVPTEEKRRRDNSAVATTKKKPTVEVPDPNMGNTNVVVIESLDNRMYQYMWAATHRNDQSPVFGVCDELGSVLLFNKMYGQSVSMRVAETLDADSVPEFTEDSNRRESYDLFSAFHPRLRRERLNPQDWGFQITYGGLNDDGSLRPLLMCERTSKILEESGKVPFGWRALMYINNGSSNDHPTGIVALEGWSWNVTKKPFTHPDTKNTYEIDEFTECDNFEESTRRISALVEFANGLATLLPVAISLVDGIPTVSEPRLIDADEEEMAPSTSMEDVD